MDTTFQRQRAAQTEARPARPRPEPNPRRVGGLWRSGVQAVAHTPPDPRDRPHTHTYRTLSHTSQRRSRRPRLSRYLCTESSQSVAETRARHPLDARDQKLIRTPGRQAALGRVKCQSPLRSRCPLLQPPFPLPFPVRRALPVRAPCRPSCCNLWRRLVASALIARRVLLLVLLAAHRALPLAFGGRRVDA